MSSLKTLRLEVTQRCPLACSHCSVSAGRGKQVFMPLGGARELIVEFADQGGQDLVITGGEPLLHPHLMNIAKIAKAHTLRTTLFSMGVVVQGGLVPVHQQTLGALAQIVDMWRISLHAASAVEHDKLTRTPGSFQATCAAIRKILASGMEVGVTFLAYPSNLSELNAVAFLCDELGVSDLRVLTCVEQGRAALQPGRFDVSALDLREQIHLANTTNRVNVRLGEASRARQFEENGCRAVEQELVVNWHGWISPCHSVEPASSDSPFDNVFLKPLRDVVLSSPRLAGCRMEWRRAYPRGCADGCIVQAAARNASKRPELTCVASRVFETEAQTI